MRTRAKFGALIVVVLAVSAGTRAQDAEPTPPADDAPQLTTAVDGTAPKGIDGRWFALAHLALPKDQVINVVAFLDVDLEAPEPTVTKRFVKLPEAQQTAFDAANRESKSWSPTADELTEIAAMWDELPPDDQGVTALETVVFSHDAFDATISENPGMKDARWAIRQKAAFRPGDNRAMSQVNVLAVTEDRPDGWSGPYATVTVAAAPFPVPIAFNGTVDIHRLPENASRGFLARFSDMFSGCGR